MNKLLEFQKKVGILIKDEVNPFFKSKYADINSLIETIKPVLNELGLVIVQPLNIVDGKNALKTILMDDKEILAESAIILPDNLDPQKIGSAITYYRRYSLQALLLLQAQDDDANSTTEQNKITYQPTPQYVQQSAQNRINTVVNQKVVGQTCPQCGEGKIVVNPATGKSFCDKKCWLNKPPKF